jgi:hypothetical protein
MLPPFTPLDRTTLFVLVCVRFFGQMLQHGHKTVQTLAHLSMLLLEHLPFAFRLHKALMPLFREGVVLRLVLAPLQGSAQYRTLIFWDHIGKPVSLTLNDGDNHINPVVILKTRINCEKVTIERTFDAPRGVGESVDLAAYLHDVPLLR